MADFSCIDQKNVPLAGSNELETARAVPRLCRGRSACWASLWRREPPCGPQSLGDDRRDGGSEPYRPRLSRWR